MNIEKFWCGTEESLAQLLLVIKARAERQVDAASIFNTNKPAAGAEKEVPRLFSQVGSVGVIAVNGPLVNSDSFWNKYDGVTGYPEIRDALIHAATDASVGAIVLDINSGGGSVSGVSDTADLISKIDGTMKPVHTFSDGAIASAAYWLGSSARSVGLGKVAEAGSIGVLTVHKEISKMLAEAGIGVTVMKAGEFKALGNQYEPLSDKAKAEIQGQLDTLYKMFGSHVAEQRSVSYEAMDKTMGQGRVFMGQAAVDVRLADSVTTFDAVMSKVQGEIDAKKSGSQYGTNLLKGPAVKQALTEQHIAATLEAGGQVTAKTAEEIAAEAADTAAKSAAAKPAAVEGEPAAGAENDLVAFLKSSLATANAGLLTKTIELRDAKAQVEGMQATHSALRSIAATSVDRLKVALGGTATGTEALTDTALLAEHASLRAQFEAKFKVGGVAAVSALAESKEAVAVDDPLRKARIASTRVGK